jgi:hypothetical protein
MKPTLLPLRSAENSNMFLVRCRVSSNIIKYVTFTAEVLHTNEFSFRNLLFVCAANCLRGRAFYLVAPTSSQLLFTTASGGQTEADYGAAPTFGNPTKARRPCVGAKKAVAARES